MENSLSDKISMDKNFRDNIFGREKFSGTNSNCCPTKILHHTQFALLKRASYLSSGDSDPEAYPEEF